MIPALARLSGWLQGLLLVLAVALLFVVDDLQLSSSCVLLWMLLALLEQHEKLLGLALGGLLEQLHQVGRLCSVKRFGHDAEGRALSDLHGVPLSKRGEGPRAPRAQHQPA